ncbi:MAG: translation initiation factor IF-2 N-terminal domain-containing protein, partial [Alphaproteobacteria bacterium]
MTDQDTKKVLSLGGRPKLELKKPVSTDGGAAGSVRQSFSHGRSKTVAVEVKQRKRTDKDAPPATDPARQQMVSGPEPGTSVSVNERGRATSAVIRQLTNEERDARARALRGAVLEGEKRETEASYTAPSEAGVEQPTGPVTRDTLRARELEELRRIQEQEKTDSERRRAEDDARSGRRGESNDRMRAATRLGDLGTAKPVAGRHAVGEEEEEGGARRGHKAGRGAPAPRRNPNDTRRAGARLTVTQALTDDEGGGIRRRSVASMRRRIEREKRQAMQPQEQVKVTRDVTIPEAITVQELANRMAERGADVIKALMKMGVMATITQTIDPDTAELVATEFGHRIKRVAESDIEADTSGIQDDPANMKPRPPVVTVMGHV